MVTLNNPTVAIAQNYVWSGTDWVKRISLQDGSASVTGSVVADMRVLINGVWSDLVSDANGNLLVNATAQDAHGLPVIQE